MRNRVLPRLLVPVIAGATVASGWPAAAAPMFMGLGDLPGGIFESQANAVSAHGSVVVGFSSVASGHGVEAFRWQSGIMTPLGQLPGSTIQSIGRGVSADGSVIVGMSNSQVFRWEAGVIEPLGTNPNGPRDAFGVSGDGSVIVGHQSSISGTEAFRAVDGAISGLGDLTGGSFHSAAYGVSADGSVVVGESTSELGTEPFRWEGGTMTGLGLLPGSVTGRALGLSASGSVVVGDVSGPAGTQAFRWETGVMLGLGDLAGGPFLSEARAVSADGSTIVGSGRTGSGQEAFVWNEVLGMRRLQDVLVSELGLDLSGWTLTQANAISADGFAIVGNGRNPDGNLEGWIAIIPEPSTGLLVMTGLLGLAYGQRCRFGTS